MNSPRGTSAPRAGPARAAAPPLPAPGGRAILPRESSARLARARPLAMEKVKHARDQDRAPDLEGDRRLMELVAANDKEAQKAFARRFLPRVQRATRALLRAPADADDATQHCLIELLRSARGFRGDGSLEAWIDRITVRTALRLARERARAHGRIDADAEPDALVGAPEEPFPGEELPRDLHEYLAGLSDVRREALVLRHVLGYSIAEVAELTGVSPNTVKDRLLAAREELRRLIRRDHLTHPRARRSA